MLASSCRRLQCAPTQRSGRLAAARHSVPARAHHHSQPSKHVISAVGSARVRNRKSPVAARALPVFLAPQGLIFEAIFAAAALAVGGIAASVFGLVFSSVFTAFAIAAAIGSVIWISTVVISTSIALGVGALLLALGVSAVTGQRFLGGGQKVRFGQGFGSVGKDPIREAEDMIQDVQSEYAQGKFVWKDGVGSFQKGPKAAKRPQVIDVELDPEEVEAKKEEEYQKQKEREIQDDLSDFDRRLRGQ